MPEDLDGEEDRRRRRFHAIFDHHNSALLAYGLRRCASAADAADLVAETFLVAWRRIDDVPPDSGTLPWLYGVARNVLSNQRRGDRRRDRLSARLASELEALTPDPSEPSANHAWVGDALQTLGALDREVLTLTLWEGLTPAEIGASLSIPAATVRTRLHRARRRVRESLEATADERSTVNGHEPANERPLVDEREGTG